MKIINKYAVIYIRQNAAEFPEISATVGEHESLCREYAKKHGYKVVGIFRDVSAEEVEIESVGLELMINFISDGGIQAVIVCGSEELPENLARHGYGLDPLQSFGMTLLRADDQRE